MICRENGEYTMSLAEYEQKIADSIYNTLIENDDNKGITLYGEIGSGKSTIALSVANMLLEGWVVFFIDGIEPSLSPYLTWHIGTKLYSKKKLELGNNITFGINFSPAPVYLEFGISANISSTNFILTPAEEAIVTSIKKQTETENNILFIADDYEKWDVPSKQLLQKIMHPKLGILSDYNLNVLVVSQNKESIDGHIPWKYIEIDDIPEESLLHILREKGFSEKICLQDIRICAGNDLSLAFIAADYYSHYKEKANRLNDILDKRFENLTEEKKELHKVLGSLSIIDDCFSIEEAAFFLDHKSQDLYETEYLAEEYLQQAEKQMLLIGNSKYRFISDKIRLYFRNKLTKREQYYHRKFSDYLQKHHPEDYYSRGKHLALSLQISDSKSIVEAWQLLLLAYIRRSTEIGNNDDVYRILEDIEKLLKLLPASLEKSQRYVLSDFINGYQEFTKQNYKQALIHFQTITFSRLVPACIAECQRLILLCHIQLAENSDLITQSANDLYNTIEDLYHLEDEQYCRAALVLIDAYIDRSNDSQKANNLKNKIIRIIQEHLGVAEFDEFEACFNRKAALYFAAIVACRQTEQSVLFYKNCCNRNGTYMALCNHSGNAIISGQYSVAMKSLDECFLMLNENDERIYPSRYKVENNKVLLDYLIEESNAHGNREIILSAANKAMTQFSKILERQCGEVSHVVLLNYIGLSILCQSNTWEKDLIYANKSLVDIDEFYQYYLNDLNYANELLKGHYSSAQQYLNKLKKLDVPLLRQYKTILKKRQMFQEDLLSNHTKINGDPFSYQNIIHAECTHIQDASCYFWGRAFLLSDLQFLSF